MENQILKRVNNFGRHERNAEWLKELRVKKDNMKQNDINITTEMTKEEDPKLEKPRTRWSSELLKKSTTLHEHMAKQVDNIISNRQGIPKWMTLVKTVLCQKENAVKEMLLTITDQYGACLSCGS